MSNPETREDGSNQSQPGFANMSSDPIELLRRRIFADNLRSRFFLEFIMSAISDSIAQLTAINAADQGAIAAVSTFIAGVQKNNADLTAQLAAIQNSPGALSAADQKSLDDAIAVLASQTTAIQALAPVVAAAGRGK